MLSSGAFVYLGWRILGVAGYDTNTALEIVQVGGADNAALGIALSSASLVVLTGYVVGVEGDALMVLQRGEQTQLRRVATSGLEHSFCSQPKPLILRPLPQLGGQWCALPEVPEVFCSLCPGHLKRGQPCAGLREQSSA